MASAERLLAGLLKLERWVALIAFAVMATVVMVDVASREFTGTGISGAPRVAVYAMIVTALISFGLASGTGRHLRPKFVDRYQPKAWEGWLTRAQEGIMAAFCLTVAIVAVDVVRETYALAEMSRMLRIAIWPMQTVIPIAFFIGAVRHGLYALYPEIRPKPKEVEPVAR